MRPYRLPLGEPRFACHQGSRITWLGLPNVTRGPARQLRHQSRLNFWIWQGSGANSRMMSALSMTSAKDSPMRAGDVTTKHGLDATEWAIDDEALLTIIRRYTREAGRTSLRTKPTNGMRRAART